MLKNYKPMSAEGLIKLHEMMEREGIEEPGLLACGIFFDSLAKEGLEDFVTVPPPAQPAVLPEMMQNSASR